MFPTISNGKVQVYKNDATYENLIVVYMMILLFKFGKGIEGTIMHKLLLGQPKLQFFSCNLN